LFTLSKAIVYVPISEFSSTTPTYVRLIQWNYDAVFPNTIRNLTPQIEIHIRGEVVAECEEGYFLDTVSTAGQ